MQKAKKKIYIYIYTYILIFLYISKYLKFLIINKNFNEKFINYIE